MGHILLVDDDEDLREAIQGFLSDEGEQVATARDGADALAVLSRGALPDVALIDVFMPVMDGLALVERMRADPRLAKIPIIVMSASKLAEPPPGTTFLSKSGLREKLRRAIAAARAAEQPS